MTENAGDIALLLLAATSEIIAKRRQTEMLCDWPEEYGGDKLLLKRIKDFLAEKSVKSQLDEALVTMKR